MRNFALILTMSALATPAVGQGATRLSAEDVRNSPHWQGTEEGIRHVPSGAVCPFSFDDIGLSMTGITMYGNSERDVSCHYQNANSGFLTMFVTDYGSWPFEGVANQSDKDVVTAKGLTRLEPGSSQCDGLTEQVLQKEPRATKDAVPAHCALYSSDSVHSALMLAPAREWIIKLRHTQNGTADGDKMTKLVISTMEAMRDLRRGIFRNTP